MSTNVSSTHSIAERFSDGMLAEVNLCKIHEFVVEGKFGKGPTSRHKVSHHGVDWTQIHRSDNSRT